MFKRRWVRWLLGSVGALVLLLLIGLGALWVIVRSDPIRQGRYKEIRLGMTRKDVIAIIGCDPGHYGRKDVAIRLVFSQHDGGWLPDAKGMGWTGNYAIIGVQLDEAGQVTYKDYIRTEPADTIIPFYYRLRGWLDR